MCSPVTALLGGASVLSAFGAVQSGSAQQQQADFAASQDNTQADQTQAAGYQQAKRIREQGRSTQGQATAALANSGVNVGTGTANDVRQKIDQNTETDALNTILSADQKAGNLRTQAAYEEQAGQNAYNAGGLNALTSVLKGGALLSKGGWKSAAQS